MATTLTNQLSNYVVMPNATDSHYAKLIPHKYSVFKDSGLLEYHSVPTGRQLQMPDVSTRPAASIFRVYALSDVQLKWVTAGKERKAK
jgi:hypothetical protein